MQFDFLCLPLFVLHIMPAVMPAVFTQADWCALRSQYENQVRVHTVAGVLEALQCGQAFQANLDIKFTAQYNQHCWVAHDATGRVIIDMELLHSSVIASWPGAVSVVGPGVEGIRWVLWGVPSLRFMLIVPVTSVPSWSVRLTLSGLQLFLVFMLLQGWYA